MVRVQLSEKQWSKIDVFFALRVIRWWDLARTCSRSPVFVGELRREPGAPRAVSRPSEIALVVELKACQGLLPIHFAQVLSYLKASDQSLGLLINFNVRLLRQGVRRVVRTRCSSQASTWSPEADIDQSESPKDAKAPKNAKLRETE